MQECFCVVVSQELAALSKSHGSCSKETVETFPCNYSDHRDHYCISSGHAGVATSMLTATTGIHVAHHSATQPIHYCRAFPSLLCSKLDALPFVRLLPCMYQHHVIFMVSTALPML